MLVHHWCWKERAVTSVALAINFAAMFVAWLVLGRAYLDCEPTVRVVRALAGDLS